MIYIGIDPGKDGAVSFITENSSIRIVDTPTLKVRKGSGKREFDVAGMVAILEGWKEPAHRVFLERIHSMPGQGVASMFSMGEGYGLWQGILAALGLSYELVTPQRWKRAMMDGAPKDKAASVLVASRLFPGSATLLRGPRGAALDGRADALLLAEYGRRTCGGEREQVPSEIGTGAEEAGIPPSDGVPSSEG